MSKFRELTEDLKRVIGAFDEFTGHFGDYAEGKLHKHIEQAFIQDYLDNGGGKRGREAMSFVWACL